ncbi:MAG: hypothetical protein WD066_19545 [Planctomycetaceae bacterium]
MRPRTGSSFAAILLFGSLLAVPLLAVFGVPEFASVSASSSGDRLRDEPLRPIETGVGESVRYTSEDLFTPFSDPARPAPRATAAFGRTPSRVGRSELDEFDLDDVSLESRVPVRPVRSASQDRMGERSLPPEALAGWEFDDEPRTERRDPPARRDEFAEAPARFADPAPRSDESRPARNRASTRNPPAIVPGDRIFEPAPDDPRAENRIAPRSPSRLSPPATGPSSNQPHGAASLASERGEVRPAAHAELAPVTLGVSTRSLDGAERAGLPRPERRPADRGPTERTPSGRTPVREAPPLTWTSAVERLKRFGIRDYQLSPGSRVDSFHFSCWYTPRDNPRVTKRFEDEASDPLRAVEKVLAQIDEWQDQR